MAAFNAEIFLSTIPEIEYMLVTFANLISFGLYLYLDLRPLSIVCAVDIVKCADVQPLISRDF